MFSTLENVKTSIEVLESEMKRMSEKGIKVASTRARAAAMDIAKDMKKLRGEIQEYRSKM